MDEKSHFALLALPLVYQIKTLLVMGISLSFICACSDNDEEPVREPEKEESLGIIGTWRHEFSTGFSYIYFDKEIVHE